MNIGKKIQMLRSELDMTQKELAERIHISYSVMNRIELGERAARDEEIKKIADVLKVSTDYLLGISDIRNNEIETIAAHKAGEHFTPEELQDIEDFKAYIRSKRNK